MHYSRKPEKSWGLSAISKHGEQGPHLRTRNFGMEARSNYDECNIEIGRHGMLLFDEVKDKEGVVLD